MTRRVFAVLTAAILTLAPQARGAVYTGGAVASDHPLAAEAGAEVLRAGGNALDATLAAAFTLSVVEPYACGVGGGGFLLLSLPDDPRSDEQGDAVRFAIDFRETAPAAVGPDYFRGKPSGVSRFGGKAVAVPGMVAGLLSAHDRFGALDLAEVLAPAIRAADEGFAVTADYAQTAGDLRRSFRLSPERQESFAYVWNDLMALGEIEEGTILKNPQQAELLRRIANEGAAAFYEGDVAEAIITSIKEAGGEMTIEDLAAYTPVDREPLIGSFRGRELMVMPPPSTGGVAMLQMLGLLDRYSETTNTPLESFEHNSVSWMHALAEAFKHAFADRNAFMGDPDHAEVAWHDLLDETYLDTLAARVFTDKARAPDEYGRPGTQAAPLPDDDGTSHLSVIDANGGAVACTLTINTDFGSLVAVEEFGFVLNNQMDDFTTRKGRANAYRLKQSEANAPAPGKRPVSSMSPTIVFTPDGEVELITGASGGPRIITSTTQAILNALVFDMNAEESVSTPRVHDQVWPRALYLEPEWDIGGQIDPDNVEELQRWMKTSKRNERMRFDLTKIGHSLRRMERIAPCR